MLIIGDHTCIPHLDNLLVYNLSSLREGYERLYLLPPTSMDYYDEKNFDLMYANYILSNDNIFFELMKVIYPLYQGIDVFIIVGRNEFYDMVTESVLKFIQQRYGYIANMVNDYSDIDFIDKDTSFTIQGLYNLDQDKIRFTQLLDSRGINIQYRSDIDGSNEGALF